MPTPKDLCPVEPCFTLSQFIEDGMNLLDSNTTLLLLPGNHSLEGNITISSVQYFTIVAPSQSASIICSESAYYEFTDIFGDVYIKGINFIGCAGNKVNCVHLLIEDCSFYGQGSKGSAIEIVDSYASIQWTLFIGHSAVVGGDGVSGGGAIKVFHSNLDIAQCLFQNNAAELGGAIYSEFYSNFTIHNSSFVGNHVTSSRLNTKTYGGAVYLDTRSIFEVRYTIIFNNTADRGFGYGGAFGADGWSFIYFTYCNLRYNIAHKGGAVYAMHTSVTIINSLVENNRGGYSGGAVFAEQAYLDVEMSTLSENSAVSGGAIYMEQEATSIRLCTFTGNTAERDGGALHVSGVILSVHYGNLRRNSAQSGGSIYSSQSTVFVNGTNFSDSVAIHNHGGAISASETKLRLLRSHFTNNSALVDGGALYCNGCTIEVAANQFMSNNASYGGAASFGNVNFTVNGSLFGNNSALIGGALHIRSVELNMIYTELSNNNASVIGGGIFAESTAIPTLARCQFTGNTAGNSFGGAIYLGTSSNANLIKQVLVEELSTHGELPCPLLIVLSTITLLSQVELLVAMMKVSLL